MITVRITITIRHGRLAQRMIIIQFIYAAKRKQNQTTYSKQSLALSKNKNSILSQDKLKLQISKSLKIYYDF